MNDFLIDLCEWLKRDLWSKKILFIRNRVAGNQILRMAASHGAPAVNVTPMSVRDYMNTLADPVLVKSGLRRIDSLTANIALQEIMKESGDAFTTMGVVELSTASSVLPQLDELERNGITPEQLAGTGEDLLASVWKSYQEWKQQNHYASEKQILDAAAIPSDVSFAILSNVEIDQTEDKFLAKIPVDKLKVINIKIPEGNESLRNSYIQKLPLFSDAKEEDYANTECFSCQDVGSEIRFAYQYLIEHQIPAEQAVIVCPDDSYALRIVEEGKLLGFGVDSYFGTPATMTRTALMIRCLLDWASRNYDTEALTPALVSGCMGIYNDRDEIQVIGQEMLRVARRQNVGWGKERWAALASSDNYRQALIGNLMKDWVDYFESPARPVRELALTLVDLFTRCMIHGEENNFYLMTIDELSQIYSGEMKGQDYLALVEEVASSRKISGQMAEKPGNVYCCSYENAMYLDRPHFMMVGMNWDAFNKLGNEFPLLHDEKKAALSDKLQLVEDRAKEKRYVVKEFLLNRPDAHVVFCRARMDYVGGEDLIASSIFDDAARKYISEDPETKKKVDHTPQINILERDPLTQLDIYLKNGFMPDGDQGCLDSGREDLWNQEFENRCYTATRLETACYCPRKYALSVQMGIDQEKPEALEQFGQAWLGAADRGNLVHNVLDQYFSAISPRLDSPDTNQLDKLLNDQIEIYKKSIPVPSNLTDLTAEIDTVRNIIYEAADMHAKDLNRKTIGTEVSFGSDQPILLSFGDYKIKLSGRIDRVDQVGSEYEIIDYKTGRPYSFRRDIKSKLQYYLYTLAWEKLHPDQHVSKASYYLLDGPGGIEQLTIEMDSETRAEMYQKMIDLLDMISDPQQAFTPRFDLDEAKQEERYNSCPDYCPFKLLCQEVFG